MVVDGDDDDDGYDNDDGYDGDGDNNIGYDDYIKLV